MTILVTGAAGYVGRNVIRTLVARGEVVRGMVRRPEDAGKVEALGARPVIADLRSPREVGLAVAGARAVVHAGAITADWGDPVDFTEVNVHGTWHVLSSALVHRVGRVVHLSADEALYDLAPLRGVDEQRPLPAEPFGPYARSKAEAERQVLRAVRQGLDACVLRPRLVWGRDDPRLLPQAVRAARGGRLRWVDGGHYLTSTCHIDNLCEGVLCALDRGRPGGVWFLTDGPPAELRTWLGAQLARVGAKVPSGAIPWRAAWQLAGFLEASWRTLRRTSEPPLTRSRLLRLGREVTLDDRRAREELGYRALTTPAEGLATLAPVLTPPAGVPEASRTA